MIFKGPGHFYKKYRGHWGYNSILEEFRSWKILTRKNFPHDKSYYSKIELKRVGMIIKNWLENCHFSNKWSIFVSKNVFIYFENFWVGIIFSITLRKLISCWKNCFWFSSYSSSLFSSCHQSRNRTISENVKMAQNTDLTHKQPKVGFLTDSYKNLKITFVKDGRGQQPRNSKFATNNAYIANCSPGLR